MTKIAIIGFGEAAQAMANGFAREAAVDVSAYDIRFGDPAQASALKALATARKVTACDKLEDALNGADIVFSLVVGSAAVPVGTEAGKHLTNEQIFIDLNSIGPDAKKRVGDAVAEGGPGQFIEGAVMARVPPYEHKVPILLAGSSAEKAASLLAGAGMEIEAVGMEIGQACAVKMIRSVVVKGIEALLIESLTAAEKAGVRERIVDSITETFPGIDWRKTATYHLSRAQQHGSRRVTEMEEASATLESLGVEPVLSRAISQTIGAAHAKFKKSSLGFDQDYPALLAVLAAEEPAKETQAA